MHWMAETPIPISLHWTLQPPYGSSLVRLILFVFAIGLDQIGIWQ
jgi:hypothetical protein